MIPELMALADKFGLTAVFLPFALGVLMTGLVFLGQSVSEWFGDRNP